MIFLNHNHNKVFVKFNCLNNIIINEILIENILFNYDDIIKESPNVISIPWRFNFDLGTKILKVSSFSFTIKEKEKITLKVNNIGGTFTILINDKRKKINSVHELQNLENHFIYELTSDLDFKDKVWIPYKFEGAIYGMGHSIKNYNFDYEKLDKTTFHIYYGLFSEFRGLLDSVNFEEIIAEITTKKEVIFGSISGLFMGIIKNVNLNGDVFIKTSNEVGNVIGGFIGRTLESVSFENCCWRGQARGNASDTGGFIGYSIDSIVKITNSCNIGYTVGSSSVGGLIGHSLNSNIVITDSYNKGNTSIYDGFASSNGGLIGKAYYSEVQINNSYNMGTVKGRSSIGGIIGISSNGLLTIMNSHNSGKILGEFGGGGLVGGFSGGTLQIVNSYNDGEIKLKLLSIGGLVGSIDRLSTTLISSSYNTSDLYGDSTTGGLMGKSDGTLTIKNSYNKGSIIGGDRIGGIVGQIGYGNEKSLVIKNCYNSGEVSGTESVGGFVGETGNGLVKITNSFNIGNISGVDDVGAISGHNLSNELFDSCYYYGEIELEDKFGTINEYGENFIDIVSLNLKFIMDVLKWDINIWNLNKINMLKNELPSLIYNK